MTFAPVERESISADCRRVRRITRRMCTWLLEQTAVGEESLTDWMLFELSNRVRWIHHKKYNRFEEARNTGADWEWWFLGRSRAGGFRVQAKKISLSDDNYPALAYSNKWGLQIEKLLEASRGAGLPALYSLYAAPSYPIQGACVEAQSKYCEGVFMGSADTIYDQFVKVARRRVTAADVLRVSCPLSRLICHVSAFAGDTIEGLEGYFRTVYPEAIPHITTTQSWIRPRAPSYATALPNFGAETWEKEFRSSLPDLAGVVVLDLRDLPETR